jgi:hypothetical protein
MVKNRLWGGKLRLKLRSSLAQRWLVVMAGAGESQRLEPQRIRWFTEGLVVWLGQPRTRERTDGTPAALLFEHGVRFTWREVWQLALRVAVLPVVTVVVLKILGVQD